MKIEEKEIEAKKREIAEDLYLVRSEDGRECLVRAPNRQDLSYVSVVRDPIKRKETLLKQLWVEGDDGFLHDDRLFLSLASKLDGLLELKEVSIKKV